MSCPCSKNNRTVRKSVPWVGRGLLGLSLVAALGIVGCSHGGAPEWGAVAHDMRHGTNPDPDPGDGSSAPDLAQAPTSEPDWTKLAAYLDSLWNASKSLLREVPGGNTYWTSPDNGLAARAYQYLPTPNLARRDQIISTLQSYKICGCADLAEHDAILNHLIDPVVTKGAQIPLTPSSGCQRLPENANSPTGSCGAFNNTCPGSTVQHTDYAQGGWYGDACNFGICNASSQSGWNSATVGKGQGDLIALQILNLRNRGSDTETLWQSLLAKWDGKGINDGPAAKNGQYQTDKLALFKICARVLGKPLPPGVDDKLKEAQGPNGGIRTTYKSDGSFTLDQQGNAETTALVVIAYRKPVADF